MGILGGLYLVDFTHQRLAGDAKPAAFGHVQSVTNQTLTKMAKRTYKRAHGCMSMTATPLENVLRKHHELATRLLTEGKTLKEFPEAMKRQGVIFSPILFAVMVKMGIYTVTGKRGVYKSTGKAFTFPKVLTAYHERMEGYETKKQARKEPVAAIAVPKAAPAAMEELRTGEVIIYSDRITVKVIEGPCVFIFDVLRNVDQPWGVKLSGKAVEVQYQGKTHQFIADTWKISSGPTA